MCNKSFSKDINMACTSKLDIVRVCVGVLNIKLYRINIFRKSFISASLKIFLIILNIPRAAAIINSRAKVLFFSRLVARSLAQNYTEIYEEFSKFSTVRGLKKKKKRIGVILENFSTVENGLVTRF